MSDYCKFKKDVKWKISKKSINNILVNPISGLLYKDIECAGVIKYNECKNNKEICDKTVKKLYINEGDESSVETPLDIINFHTHPLNCYINANTIWGWPSGEDLKICIDFAEDGNLTHIIFAVEGTYIIDVNKNLLNLFKTQIGKKIKNYIKELFKYTHVYRQYKPNNLDSEFTDFFLKPCKLKFKKNILYSWLYLINNLTINNINNLLKNNDFNINYNIHKFNNKIINTKIYNIKFIKNKTKQWDNNLSKTQIFNELSKKQISNKFNNNIVDIVLPNKIEYTAPFVSHKCNLN